MKSLLDSISRPLIVAHRGGAGEAAENTCDAFEQSAEVGIRFIETDVWLGSDGELYVHHGRVRDMFRRNPIKDVTGLPRIEQILRRYPTIFFSIDPKQTIAFKPLIEIIQQLDAQNRVCISSSFYWRSKQAIRQTPHLKGANIMLALPALGIVTNLLPKALLPFLNTISKTTIIAYPPKWMAAKWLISLAHKNNLLVMVQNVNNPNDIAKFVHKGANGFMTDYPKALVATLNKTEIHQTLHGKTDPNIADDTQPLRDN